ncbi:hypothetical protein FDECE_13264 [Fusarium decemcellulare]|nr:hypothetical protein FDECE_13264 [Fusarium decemcellulare]
MAQQPQPVPVAPSVPIRLPPSLEFAPSVLAPVSGDTGDDSHGVGHGVIPEKQDDAQNEKDLGVLFKFKGTFSGFGFNTIFRPSSTATPSVQNVNTTDPDDNVLQLNLTSETMTFSEPLGEVPNRGLGKQPDITLHGIPYTQTILDTTVLVKPPEKQPTIHFEPGLWMRVPASTAVPKLQESFARMASIPHGTTINAQCFRPAVTKNGAPEIPDVGITPVFLQNGQEFQFKNQSIDQSHTRRIPQDLTPFSEAGTITQEILDNPNLVLRNANQGKEIIENTTFTVSTDPKAAAGLGGGTSNIGFLIGSDLPNGKSSGNQPANANAVRVTATYWISTVRTQIRLDPSLSVCDNEKAPKTVSPEASNPRDAVPKFIVDVKVTKEQTVPVEYTQIQYSQEVALDFNGLGWPHVTVATLAPTNLSLGSIKGLNIQ